YTILPDGKYLIEQLSLMGISMDKFKTATTGKALKQVFRGELAVDGAVDIAKNEIRAVFEKGGEGSDFDIGFFGDKVGKCPLCGGDVVKGKYSYGCRGYKEGCKFRLNLSICRRAIPIHQAKKLLAEGSTDLLTGFISPRTGNAFDARLRLEDGKAVFDFNK
ncbi:MAG: topoisomerase C-terminal repeat-containing protein, partial [Clostridia bacterium]|nr:topoisomerase C-terminal repeat-containing protein [Clostridia bacterium]